MTRKERQRFRQLRREGKTSRSGLLGPRRTVGLTAAETNELRGFEKKRRDTKSKIGKGIVLGGAAIGAGAILAPMLASGAAAGGAGAAGTAGATGTTAATATGATTAGATAATGAAGAGSGAGSVAAEKGLIASIKAMAPKVKKVTDAAKKVKNVVDAGRQLLPSPESAEMTANRNTFNPLVGPPLRLNAKGQVDVTDGYADSSTEASLTGRPMAPQPELQSYTEAASPYDMGMITDPRGFMAKAKAMEEMNQGSGLSGLGATFKTGGRIKAKI